MAVGHHDLAVVVGREQGLRRSSSRMNAVLAPSVRAINRGMSATLTADVGQPFKLSFVDDGMPSCLAFSSLLPASSPART